MRKHKKNYLNKQTEIYLTLVVTNNYLNKKNETYLTVVVPNNCLYYSMKLILEQNLFNRSTTECHCNALENIHMQKLEILEYIKHSSTEILLNCTIKAYKMVK
jgi:hypothetical protein